MFTRSETAPPSADLTMRQRLACIVGTSASAEKVMSMADHEIDYHFFLAHGVKAALLRAAQITPLQLKQRGVRSTRELRALGYDVLDLVDASFCATCVSAYGANSLLDEFLVTPTDAVVLAGTSAFHQLGLDVGTLLLMCSGAPASAREVLAQTTPRATALQGVAVTTLLDSGLRAKQLRELGFGPEAVAQQCRASAVDLERLDF